MCIKQVGFIVLYSFILVEGDGTQDLVLCQASTYVTELYPQTLLLIQLVDFSMGQKVRTEWGLDRLWLACYLESSLAIIATFAGHGGARM